MKLGGIVKLLLHIILYIYEYLNRFLFLFFLAFPDDKEKLIALYLQSEMMSAAKEATKQKREAKKLLANAIASGDDVAGTRYKLDNLRVGYLFFDNSFLC